MTQIVLFMTTTVNAIPPSYYVEYILLFIFSKYKSNYKHGIVKLMYGYRNDNILFPCESCQPHFRPQFSRVPTLLFLSSGFHKLQTFLPHRFQITISSSYQNPQFFGSECLYSMVKNSRRLAFFQG